MDAPLLSGSACRAPRSRQGAVIAGFLASAALSLLFQGPLPAMAQARMADPVAAVPTGGPAAGRGAAEASRAGGRSPLEVCPVDGPRHFADDFGAPRWAGGFHRHEGVDVFAPLGTAIRAPFDGVAEASTSWAGGIQLKVTGRLGFVLNVHMSSVSRTGRVRAGQVVGRVGNTGDASGGATHDHFEWHPRGGPAVDPYLLFRRACRRPRLPTPTDHWARL